jgi:hypothetical protein
MAELTPYDTGERLEPAVWRPRPEDPDSYGRVDFENDEGATEFTVWFEKQQGEYVMHVQCNFVDEPPVIDFEGLE